MAIPSFKQKLLDNGRKKQQAKRILCLEDEHETDSRPCQFKGKKYCVDSWKKFHMAAICTSSIHTCYFIALMDC